MTDPLNPSSPQAVDRTTAIARLLSRAFLRLRQRGGCSSHLTSESEPESRSTSLEVRARSRPTVPTG